MPVYDKASQDSFLITLRDLMTSYGINVSSLKDNADFKVDFMDLIIKKDRQEARRIAEVLKANLTTAQWLGIKNIIISNFPEITSEIG